MKIVLFLLVTLFHMSRNLLSSRQEHKIIFSLRPRSRPASEPIMRAPTALKDVLHKYQIFHWLFGFE